MHPDTQHTEGDTARRFSHEPTKDSWRTHPDSLASSFLALYRTCVARFGIITTQHSDKPLISLHFCLLPVHVGPEPKKRGIERGGSVSVSWELETAGTGPGVAVPVLDNDNEMVGTCESTDEGIVDHGYEHKPRLLYGALTFPYKFQLGSAIPCALTARRRTCSQCQSTT
jgi:hypothetical protein